jgi:hypothetical protein
MALEELLPFAGMAALAGVFLVFAVIIALALYVYTSWAMMTIARKLKYDKGWLAWIPIVNLVLWPILAKKREGAWPWVFIMLVPIVNIVFMIMWTWQIYELRKYPGWLSLITLLGFVPVIGGLAGIANIIILGLVAWKDR